MINLFIRNKKRVRPCLYCLPLCKSRPKPYSLGEMEKMVGSSIFYCIGDTFNQPALIAGLESEPFLENEFNLGYVVHLNSYYASPGELLSTKNVERYILQTRVCALPGLTRACPKTRLLYQ